MITRLFYVYAKGTETNLAMVCFTRLPFKQTEPQSVKCDLVSFIKSLKHVKLY